MPFSPQVSVNGRWTRRVDEVQTEISRITTETAEEEIGALVT